MKDVKVYAQNLRSYNMGFRSRPLDYFRNRRTGITKDFNSSIYILQKIIRIWRSFDYEADFEISEFEDIYELIKR